MKDVVYYMNKSSLNIFCNPIKNCNKVEAVSRSRRFLTLNWLGSMFENMQAETIRFIWTNFWGVRENLCKNREQKNRWWPRFPVITPVSKVFHQKSPFNQKILLRRCGFFKGRLAWTAWFQFDHCPSKSTTAPGRTASLGVYRIAPCPNRPKSRSTSRQTTKVNSMAKLTWSCFIVEVIFCKIFVMLLKRWFNVCSHFLWVISLFRSDEPWHSYKSISATQFRRSNSKNNSGWQKTYLVRCWMWTNHIYGRLFSAHCL